MTHNINPNFELTMLVSWLILNLFKLTHIIHLIRLIKWSLDLDQCYPKSYYNSHDKQM